MSNELEHKLEYDALMKRYLSAQSTIKQLAERINFLENRNLVLEAVGEQWEDDKIAQATIIQQQLESGDRKVRDLQEEIIELKELLKENGIEYRN